jgi:hypothetical protein
MDGLLMSDLAAVVTALVKMAVQCDRLIEGGVLVGDELEKHIMDLQWDLENACSEWDGHGT